MTFDQKVPKLNSRPVYCSRLYGKLFTVKGGKFKFSAQGRDLALFVDNGTKVKIPSDIKLPLRDLIPPN